MAREEGYVGRRCRVSPCVRCRTLLTSCNHHFVRHARDSFGVCAFRPNSKNSLFATQWLFDNKHVAALWSPVYSIHSHFTPSFVYQYLSLSSLSNSLSLSVTFTHSSFVSWHFVMISYIHMCGTPLITHISGVICFSSFSHPISF